MKTNWTVVCSVWFLCYPEVAVLTVSWSCQWYPGSWLEVLLTVFICVVCFASGITSCWLENCLFLFVVFFCQWVHYSALYTRKSPVKNGKSRGHQAAATPHSTPMKNEKQSESNGEKEYIARTSSKTAKSAVAAETVNLESSISSNNTMWCMWCCWITHRLCH